MSDEPDEYYNPEWPGTRPELPWIVHGSWGDLID
jgi:hypothetical protein